jgi:hypothetical protein
MEKIKLEKSGNFMWVTDLQTNTVTRFPAKDTYYAFEDRNKVLVLTWDKNNGETYHRYNVSELVDSNEEPWSSFAELDTFLAENLGFNGGGGTSGTTQNLSETLNNGNQTDGFNIFVNDSDYIELENGSLIKKGTYDFGGFGDVIVSGITNTGDGYINGIMGWGDPSGTLWSDLNGTYIKTSVAVTPAAFSNGDIGMHTPQPGTFNYYLENPISMGSPNSAWNGVAYFLAPGNRSGWGNPNDNGTTDPVVNYWRLCVLSDYPYVYFINPSSDPYNFPTSGWVPIDDTVPSSEGGGGYTYIANYGGGFAANISNTLNGNGGISRICSIGYEDMWQAGVRYVFGNSGSIRHATNGFTIIPGSSFDYTKNFAVGSLWTLDNGDTYVCTDNSLNAAVWELYSSPTPKYKVYTALLTQSGGDNTQNIDSVDLTIGVTYFINNNVMGDFTNVGAPNNDNGTYFVATGTTPTDWGINLSGNTLTLNTGAPTVIVLENTIGNIWFTYNVIGQYICESDNLFTIDKTTIDIDSYGQNANPAALILNSTSNPVNKFTIITYKSGYEDDILTNNRIEIKVYN